MYAIKRLQAGRGTWYWVVNFSRRGVHHERRFYDPKHGGKDAALRAAIAWRDEELAKAKVLGVLEFCQHKRSNNSSGVPGVHFLTPAAQPEGIWQAKLKLADGTPVDKDLLGPQARVREGLQACKRRTARDASQRGGPAVPV